MPKVTIGIPVYNEARFIYATLSSAISQINSFNDLEIIVSDNASTDRTLLEINKALDDWRRPKNIKIISCSSNIGASNNFWQVFNESDSEFFLWLGGHDILSENFIKLGVDFLSRNLEYSMFSGTHFSINLNDQIENNPIKYDFEQKNPYERYLLSILKLSNCYIFHSIFKRANLMEYLRKDCPSEDRIIISRLLWLGKLHQSKECAYIRRYFSEDNRAMKNDQGFYVHSEKNIHFYESYLLDFNELVKEFNPFIKNAMLGQVSEFLFKRNGLPFVENN